MPSSEGPIIASTTATKPLEILIAGASYAGLAATVNLLDLCAGQPCRFTRTVPASGSLTGSVPIHITLVDERDGYYHLIGQPLACASQSYAESAWTKFSDIAALQTPRVSCVQGKVVEVDCARKVARVVKHGAATDEQPVEYAYDYFIAASGLRRVWPTAPRALTRTAYLSEIKEQLKNIDRCENGVVVIGGGAVGIEMAAELKLMKPECHVTLVHSRTQLLSNEDLPLEYKERALSMLEGAGVHTILDSRVDNISVPSKHEPKPSQYNLTLSNGKILHADQVINAVSHTSPTTSYLPNCALDKDGLVQITPRLNFSTDTLPNTEYHFAAGDLASWSGIKRAGGAMHHGHYTAVNIHQHALSQSSGGTPSFLELQYATPSICLAIGKEATSYNTFEGVKFGKDVMELYFGNDLGNKICWNYMQLGRRADVVASQMKD